MVLAVNIEAKQDAMVMPLITGNAYLFTPLKNTEEVGKAYGVLGAPQNVLIDRDGLMISPQILLGTSDDERRLEGWLEILLAQH